jgi:hypothetical protein
VHLESTSFAILADRVQAHIIHGGRPSKRGATRFLPARNASAETAVTLSSSASMG